MKMRPTEWEKMFASHISDKGLIWKYVKNSYNSTEKTNKQQINNPFEKWAEEVRPSGSVG